MRTSRSSRSSGCSVLICSFFSCRSPPGVFLFPLLCHGRARDKTSLASLLSFFSPHSAHSSWMQWRWSRFLVAPSSLGMFDWHTASGRFSHVLLSLLNPLTGSGDCYSSFLRSLFPICLTTPTRNRYSGTHMFGTEVASACLHHCSFLSQVTQSFPVLPLTVCLPLDLLKCRLAVSLFYFALIFFSILLHNRSSPVISAFSFILFLILIASTVHQFFVRLTWYDTGLSALRVKAYPLQVQLTGCTTLAVSAISSSTLLHATYMMTSPTDIFIWAYSSAHMAVYTCGTVLLSPWSKWWFVSFCSRSSPVFRYKHHWQTLINQSWDQVWQNWSKKLECTLKSCSDRLWCLSGPQILVQSICRWFRYWIVTHENHKQKEMLAFYHVNSRSFVVVV